ncbi:hypothetical protein ACIBQ6_12655 [Nonomuraea sp. NPDC049655]
MRLDQRVNGWPSLREPHARHYVKFLVGEDTTTPYDLTDMNPS